MKSFLEQIVENFQALDEKAKSTEKYDDNPKLKGDQDELPDALQKAIIEKEVKNPGKYTTGIENGYDRDGDGVPNGADPDPDDGDVNEDLEEASMTGAGEAFNVPTAFSTKAQYKKKKKMKYPGVAEAMDRKYEQLIEGYREFALGNGKRSPNQTVNSAIREVAKKLKEIEETVKYTGRLKTESGIAHSGFSSGTHNALRKISERLIKISERVRSLGE